jgi:hypothetical protein
MMMVVAAHLVTVMVHGAVMAAMAGADADGQGLRGPTAQHRKSEGGDNELFHDNILGSDAELTPRP